ncbi:hypothetical protein ACN28S_58360 [Cystobacter fuscus]
MTNLAPYHAQIKINETIGDRFEIERRIGEPGQTGYALVAFDRLLRERVVCKLCMPHIENPLAHILSQYRKLWGILSPDIARPRGVFVHPGASPIPFLVLEFIEGPTLSAWSIGKTLRDRLTALWHIANAIDQLESKGIRHGDLHGDNILCPPGRFVIIDPQASELGYSQGSNRRTPSTQPPQGLSDIVAWSLLARELLGPNSDLIKHLNEQVYDNANPGLEAKSIAAVIERLINGTWISSDEGNTLQDLADEYRYQRTESARVFTRIRSARTTVIASLVDQIAELSKPLDIRLDYFIGSESEFLAKESAADNAERGFLLDRRIGFRSPDGNEFLIRIEPQGPFRKPWPNETKGLISKGDALVIIDGHQVVQEKLSLMWKNEHVLLLAEELDKFVPFDESRIERLLRILIGHTVAGVMTPISVVSSKIPRSNWKKSIAVEDGDFVIETGGQLGVVSGDAWLRQSIEESLHGHEQEAQAGMGIFKNLSTIFDATSPRLQQRIVDDVVQRDLLLEYGGYIDVIYRFDVLDLSEAKKSFTVEIDLRPHQGKRVTWRFRVSQGY